jgi:dihydrofolate reductase
MRKLVVTQNVTLDGSIEMLTDWFLPQGQGLGEEPTDESDQVEEIHRQDANADALLVGRQTFTDFRGYWRDLADDDTGISDYLNSVQKYVVSSAVTDPDWQNTTVIGDDPADAVRRLKQQPGKDIVLTGSIRLCHTMIAAGLVDEYRLFVYPSVQGRGEPLFPEGVEIPRLTLLETKAFRSGVTLSRYAVRGAGDGPADI